MASRSQKASRRPPGLRRRFSPVRLAIQIFLMLLLVVQILVLFKDSWDVPRPLLARLHQKLAEEGWRISYENLAFQLPARITATAIRVSRVDGGEPIAEAEIGRIDLSFGKLLQGKLEVQKGTLYGGAVFCPAAISPTGERETVMEKTHAVVSQGPDGIRIHNLNGMLNNLAVTLSGEIPIPAPEEEAEPTDWERQLGIVLTRIVRERETMRRAEQPRLHLRLEADGDTLGVLAEGWAERIRAPLDIDIRRPHFISSGTFEDVWMGEKAEVEIEQIVWDSRITAHHISASAAWPRPSSKRSPELAPNHADIHVAEVTGAAEAWRDIHARFSLSATRRVTLNLFALFHDEPLEGDGHLDWSTGDGRLNLVSRLNPTALFESELAHEFDLPFDIAFRETPFARATAWMENWNFVRAVGRAHARETNIDGVFFHQATARAELYPDRFVVPEMALAFEDVAAHGSYEVWFDDFAYRLLFAGDVRPLHIRAWFRDWWVGLWERFEFPAQPLRGDIDIHGMHGHGERMQLFGSVQARDFSLRDVLFNSLDARLTVSGNTVRLFDMTVRRPEGGAVGWFEYAHDQENGRMDRLDFEAHSTLDPIEVARVFGDSGVQLFAPFAFTEAPAILLGGTVYGPARRNESRITATGRSSAPLEYYGVALDRLLVDLLVEGSDWSLRQIDAGLAGGELSGDARKWTEEGEDRLRFSVILLNLELPVVLQGISTWRAGMGLDGINQPPPENLGGTIDASIQATGTPGDLTSYEGNGHLRIRDANLAEIHLLGLLSRLLAATPLRFTSLQFTDAEATFVLEQEEIRFPSLILTGPSAEIQATGDYNSAEEALDFSLKLHAMRQSRIPFLPVILSPVLEPLAHMLEIELTGPLSDPKWRFLLGPSNLLDGLTGNGDNEGSTGENE